MGVLSGIGTGIWDFFMFYMAYVGFMIMIMALILYLMSFTSAGIGFGVIGILLVGVSMHAVK